MKSKCNRHRTARKGASMTRRREERKFENTIPNRVRFGANGSGSEDTYLARQGRGSGVGNGDGGEGREETATTFFRSFENRANVGRGTRARLPQTTFPCLQDVPVSPFPCSRAQLTFLAWPGQLNLTLRVGLNYCPRPEKTPKSSDLIGREPKNTLDPRSLH